MLYWKRLRQGLENMKRRCVKFVLEVARLPEEMICQICRDQGEDVLMDYDKQYNFWRCPVCHTETWIDEKRIEVIRTEKKTAELIETVNKQMRWAVGGRFTEVKSLVPATDPKKKGGSKSSRKRKPAEKKPKSDIFYDS